MSYAIYKIDASCNVGCCFLASILAGLLGDIKKKSFCELRQMKHVILYPIMFRLPTIDSLCEMCSSCVVVLR